MERWHTSDPQTLEYRSGGGCAALFGLPFVLGGALTMVAPILEGKGDLVPLLLTVPFGALFAIIGLALALGRSRLVFDRRRSVVRSWWGILGWGPTTETPLVGRTCVSMATETRGSGKNRHTVHPVRLEGGDHESHEIAALADTGEARRLAEEVAKFLDVGVVDRTSGDEILREAGSLDESVRDRLARLGRRPEQPPRPSAARSRHTPLGSTQRFDIPATGFNCGHVLLFFAAAFLGLPGAAGLVALSSDPDAPLVVALAVGGFFVLPALAIIVYAIADSRTTWFIEATPMRLLVERRGLFTTRNFEFPGHELEELEVAGKKSDDVMSGTAILARSDRQEVRFGSGLEPDELAWIKACLEVGLCS